MLHFGVIADLETCGTNERSRQWMAGYRDCAAEMPDVSFASWLIPRLPLDDQHFMGAVRDAYHGIADGLGRAIGNAPSSDRFVVVLDARLSETINQVSSLQSVQGLLILSFPDVLWVPVFKGKEEASRQAVRQALDLAMGGFNPLFDGTGIRGALIKTHKTNSAYRYDRDDVAVTVDEERHFAELNAYTAFRFGYRVYPVSTECLSRQILGVKAKSELPSLAGVGVSPEASLVVFEDGDIAFPDCNQADNKKHQVGNQRMGAWPLLKEANLRVLATAYGAEEKIANDGQMTAGAWFREAKVQELCRGKRKALRATREKARRQVFNLCAGGMGDVWVWNVCKAVLIVGALLWILSACPAWFVPALLLVFAAFGVFRNAIAMGVVRLFGHWSRVRTFFTIRAQWRFYPKLYASHWPQKKIRREGARFWCFVRKPLGGIFGLRNQCGLPNGRNFDGPLNEQKVRWIFRNARKGRIPTETGEDVSAPTHSAYGMTLDIATDLIGRARAMKARSKGMDVEWAIHAAVLATCAYELLGHKTPALSIEALGLRHHCEVLAECDFPGIRARLDMEDRWVDIHNSLWQICRGAKGEVREEMFESGMAAICDDLSELLRLRGRREEAAFLTRQSRYMHRLLLAPIWRYLLAFPEWVVRSKLNFAASFILFSLVFLVSYCSTLQFHAGWEDVLSKAKTLFPSLWSPEFGKNAHVHAMRQVVLLHVGFLVALFNDFLHRK